MMDAAVLVDNNTEAVNLAFWFNGNEWKEIKNGKIEE